MRKITSLLILVMALVTLSACRDNQIKHTDLQVVYFTYAGDNSVPTVSNLKVNDKLTEPEAPERPGFRFVMWSTSVNERTPWDFDTMVVTKAMTMYAVWDVGIYTIEYNLNGGSFTESQNPVYEFDGNADVHFLTPVRTGYDFEGWFTKPIEEVQPGEARTTSTTGISDDIVLYAKWTPKRIFVQFYANTDVVTGLTNPQARQVYYDSIIDFPVLTHPNYTFLGWFDASGNQYINGAQFTKSSATKLYAHWEAK